MQNIYFSCKDVLYLQRPILDPCLLIQRAQKFSLGFSRSYINLDRDRTSRSLLTKRFLKKKNLGFWVTWAQNSLRKRYCHYQSSFDKQSSGLVI